ncbi:interferon lambda-3-like [Antrostomus carolinensis]|uniref:interferon lambda-3-like n=1 Tax=Antrostomus carolinensis TaxID=279965 RepID=UPI0010A98A4A|nr:interferon lambda-3-like [Antrostomus carolinensis]
MLHLGFTLLLVLVLGASLRASLGASLGATFSQDTPKKDCSLSKYQFLLPQETRAVQKMKDEFEKIMLLSDRQCNTRLFHRKWKTKELLVPDRMKLVEAELDFAINMLELLTEPELGETREQPLLLLTQAREDVRDCVSAPLKVPCPKHVSSRKLRHWLQRLGMAKETETTGCLEASAILNLFQVLNNLQCAALRERCT